jgi:Protein of unknown function (DUF1569)
MIPAFVIAVLSLWGAVSAVDQWRYAAGAGQIAATITQGAYGVLGLVVGVVAVWRPRARAPAMWLWALSLIATGALAPVVWGEESWLAGVAGGLGAVVFVALLLWWLVAATAPSLWNERPRRELLQRLSRLAPEARPRWGLMNACQMLTHVNDQFRMALGDLPTAPKPMAMRYPPLNRLVAYVLPWPKGSPTAPELLARIDQSTWAVEVATFETLLNRFAAIPRGVVWPVHPAFGRLTRTGWAKLGYRHTDHHFQQFGV